MLVEFLYPDITPGNFKRTSVSNTVYLQANESLGMGFVDGLINQGFNFCAVDPSFDFGTLGDDTKLVPLTILKYLVWLKAILGG